MKKQVSDQMDIFRIGSLLQVEEAVARGDDLTARDKYGRTILMYAAINQSPDVITEVLKTGADIEAQDKRGLTPLMWAALSNSNAEVITRLLSFGADIRARDRRGLTPLMRWAVCGESQNVLAALLKGGANVNETDGEGRTPLMHAVRSKRSEFIWERDDSATMQVIKALLSSGANIDHQDSNGTTTMMLVAAYYSRYEFSDNEKILKVLIEAGTRIDEQDRNGMTALMWAALRNKHPMKVEMLLEAGANPELRSKNGKMAYNYAYQNPKLKPPAYTHLYRLAKPWLYSDDPMAIERVAKSEARLRAWLLLIVMVVNPAATVSLYHVFFKPPTLSGFTLVEALALIFGILVNPVRLVILIIRDWVIRAKSKNRVVWQSSTPSCWKQVLWQTVLIIVLGSLVIVNVFCIPGNPWGEEGNTGYLILWGELLTLGVIAFRLRRWINSAGETIERAVAG